MLRPFIAASIAAFMLGCGSDGPDAGPTTDAGRSSPQSEVAATPTPPAASTPRTPEMQVYKVPAGSRPHDVAPATDGGVWYTAQGSGELGWLDPRSGEVREVALGAGSAPHGVIVGPDGAAWVTDGGLNAIVRVDPSSSEVKVYRLPSSAANANLNTAAFDRHGILWFTGQSGFYGRLDPKSGDMEVFRTPRGPGAYGIDATPAGDIYYASLAGNHIARINIDTGEATPIDPPTQRQGARRIWSDSKGRLWVSEWNSGQVSVFDPASNAWQQWKLPGSGPQTYAVYVDELDKIWLTDFGGNAIHRFDPENEQFETFALPSKPGNVRQLLGRPGEVWGPESAADQILVIRF